MTLSLWINTLIVKFNIIDTSSPELRINTHTARARSKDLKQPEPSWKNRDLTILYFNSIMSECLWVISKNTKVVRQNYANTSFTSSFTGSVGGGKGGFLLAILLSGNFRNFWSFLESSRRSLFTSSGRLSSFPRTWVRNLSTSKT